MNTISQTENAVANYTTAQKGEATQKKSKVTTGATIGNPELSDKAKKYYDKLKSKYFNMDFILVSEDKKGEAQANAGRYANRNRMVVLIDTDKIERMAEDESYRKKYEGIISAASGQLSQLQGGLGSMAGNVKTYGMQVNDNGTTSFFAVVDKSLAAQKKRIEKNAEKKAQQKKEDKKKADKAAEEKRAEKKKTEKDSRAEDEDTVTVTASSIEELIKKIQDVLYGSMSDYARTDQEKQVGSKFDSRG